MSIILSGNINKDKYRMSLKNVHDFFGLPIQVKRLIEKYKGICELYDWQVECLTLNATNRKKNLIYSLPTSGGKTLVAEILILKEILNFNKNVIFVLPYIAIVQEKVNSLSAFGLELGFLIDEYSGSRGVYPPPKRRKKKSVYICTIEKALGLVNSLIEENRISEIGLTVVDELHLIGESKRGALLENLLVKLLHFHIQIVGMSATIGNLADLGLFLKADIYSNNFRPVELQEYVKVENEIFLVKHNEETSLEYLKSLQPEDGIEMKRDPDGIGILVKEVVPTNSCLVFCPSKSNCENVSLMICEALKESTFIEHKKKEKIDLLSALVVEGNGQVCPILRKTLRYGVAYHHSGLTAAERKLLEEAYMFGTVCCICCTSTLAAGVNLPAQRVILRSPYIGSQFINLSRYKQMIGRAGRTGLGTKGESFLLCKPMETQKVGNLLDMPMNICQSQLLGEELNNFVLSLISLNLASDKFSIINFVNRTFLKIQAESMKIDINKEIELLLSELMLMGALEDGERVRLSPLARAAVKGNFSYTTAKELYSDLKVAQENLVLVGHLHLLYLITPYSAINEISPIYDVMFSTYVNLGQKELTVARTLGINESCINQILAGRKVNSVPTKVLQRFYTSLIVNDLWNGMSIWDVSKKYKIPRGAVSNLLGATSSFAAAVIRFCEVFENLWCFVKLLSIFPEKLNHCCESELVALMELPAVKVGRARQLYKAGYKNLASIARSEPQDLVIAVHHLPIKHAKQIVSVAKLLLLAKYESLQDEAEKVLKGE